MVAGLAPASPTYDQCRTRQNTKKNLMPVYQERVVVSSYVGMARKQDGAPNGCISNYTTITQLGAGFTHL